MGDHGSTIQTVDLMFRTVDGVLLKSLQIFDGWDLPI
jgi:hypothetical protein